MSFEFICILVTAILFIGMFALINAGWWLGRRRLATTPKEEQASLGIMEGFIFGLLGLLIAFSFTGAMGRFDTRKALIMEEANDISTAYLRLDLLTPEAQKPLRDEFRDYTDSRINYFRHLDDENVKQTEKARFTKLQGDIWNQAVAATQSQTTTTSTMLLLPALNTMFDITSTREMATTTHPPAASFILLVCLVFASSFLAGFAMRDSSQRSWPHIFAFVLMAGATVYLIVDVEFPRMGLIRVDSADFAMQDVRDMMR
jgi:hypothetical protein